MPALSSVPTLSYIVLSYNYAQYIEDTIRSILDQSVQDFEIIIVDDASTDASLDVIRRFDDQRIRLFVNERNIGGAASYNRAVELTRGSWLVNLDADDWIAPKKSEIQLSVAAAQPHLDIIGTYVNFFDKDGRPHSKAKELEAFSNRRFDLTSIDTWVGNNPLARSSTMIRRSAHARIGLDDPSMVRAPDYELWTRALRHGCHFGVVPEPLTFLRLQESGVTHADPLSTALELSYAMLRNLVPLAEKMDNDPAFNHIASWIIKNPQLNTLPPFVVHRLAGMVLEAPPPGTFDEFRSLLFSEVNRTDLTRLGQRTLSLLSRNSKGSKSLRRALKKLRPAPLVRLLRKACSFSLNTSL
jgi:GT2 family glycosyltransferase